MEQSWIARHNRAMQYPRGFETSIVSMFKGWVDYAQQHNDQYESLIGDDGVLGPEWEAIGDALRGLLNGDCGRLDCGTIDAEILAIMRQNGVETEKK